MAVNFRTLDLNLLRVFDVVMAEGSITRAAQRLSMTQPAVSNALKRLRDSLGEDLLTRAPRGVQPTAFGEALWPQVRSSLGQLREALEPGDFDPTVETRVFRLTMADAAAALMMPALMARFEVLGAHCHVEVRPLLDRDPRNLLGHGDIDFAVGHFPEAVAALVAQGRVAPLRHRRLAESRYVCAMRRDHPLAAEPLTLDAFCAASHVLVSFSGRPHGFVDHALASLKRTRQIALTVNQFFTAAHVVACQRSPDGAACALPSYHGAAGPAGRARAAGGARRRLPRRALARAPRPIGRPSVAAGALRRDRAGRGPGLTCGASSRILRQVV